MREKSSSNVDEMGARSDRRRRNPDVIRRHGCSGAAQLREEVLIASRDGSRRARPRTTCRSTGAATTTTVASHREGRLGGERAGSACIKTPVANLGEKCGLDGANATAIFCRDAYCPGLEQLKSSTCMPYVKAGQPCNDDKKCEEPYECLSGTCRGRDPKLCE